MNNKINRKIFLSIIIPVYNSGQTLDTVLSSIFNNDISEIYEVILIDDCSKDNSIKIAEKYDVKIFSTKSNSGPAYARNLGAEKANGTLLLFADSDVEFQRNTINNLLTHYNDFIKKGVEIVCSGFFERNPLNSGFGPELTALHCNYLLEKNFKPESRYQYIEENAFQSYCALISRKLFFEIGMFDINYKIAGGEEHDFGFRLTEKDVKQYIFLDAPVKHYFRPFFKILIVHFKRGINYLLTERKYSIKKKCYGISNLEKINFIFSILIPVFFLLSLINNLFLYSGLSLFIIHILIYNKFYFKYVLSSKSLFFFIKSIFAMQIIFFIKAVSAFCGFFLIYILKKKGNMY